MKANKVLTYHIILLLTMKVSTYFSLVFLTCIILFNQKYVLGYHFHSLEVMLLKMHRQNQQRNQNPKTRIFKNVLRENSGKSNDLEKIANKIAKFKRHFGMKYSIKNCKNMFRSSRIL